MITNLLFLMIGLFLGWFFLKPPLWADKVVTFIVEKIPFLGKFLRK